MNSQDDEQEKFYRKAADHKLDKKNDSGANAGNMWYFVLISSEMLDTAEVMLLYYMRQTIEQTFDLAKNDVALTPLRNHNDETFRGHLMLSFMATVLLITVKRVLKPEKRLPRCPLFRRSRL